MIVTTPFRHPDPAIEFRRPNLPAGLGLKPNEHLRATVLQRVSADEFLVQVKGHAVLARTNVPLQPGTRIALRVENAGPQVTLKLLSPPPGQTARVNAPLVLAALEDNLWQQLDDHLMRLAGDSADGAAFRSLLADQRQGLFSRTGPALLGELIDRSGLLWEGKLKSFLLTSADGKLDPKLLAGDLKGLAGRLLASAAEPDPVLTRFGEVLQNIQVFNHNAMENDNRLFIPVPMRFPDGTTTVGQLLIDCKDDRDEADGAVRDKQETFMITFLLELTGLGPLRADIRAAGKTIDGRFWTATAASKQMIDAGLPVLKNRLTAGGFDIRNFDCSLKSVADIKMPLVREIGAEDGHTVNLFV